MTDDDGVATMALPGLARALIAAGALSQQQAETLYARAQSHKTGFITELIDSALVSPSDLAHTMSVAFAAPLIDLDAIDPQRLPHHLLDPKTCQQYRIVPLARRGSRLSVATADPSDLQAAEKVKFETQLAVDWIIAEVDKLGKLVETYTASAGQVIEQIVGQTFDFEAEGIEMTSAEPADKVAAEVEDAPIVKFLQKMLLDAYT
ncbi:MAG: type IV-A pilus assembly ATPase PilB, partial [Burkholderiaceae bacterium]|nr:type IV-A pilus assembly ATPase PilB [Burkholderiaceae bacterium]